MPRACLLLFLGVAAFAWQESQANPELALVQRARQRMAENIERLPDYTCLETIERSVRLPGGKKLFFRDRIHLDVAYIGGKEMFAWPGSEQFDAGLFEELPRQAGAIATGGFGGWIGSLFGPSAPAFTHAGACTVEGRSGSRYTFRVPALSSTHTIVVGDQKATVAYSGSICVDPHALDILLLEVHDEAMSVPVAASSEAIRYGRTRVGGGDFQLPQYHEMAVTDLKGNEFRNITRFTACQQYTSHSSVSFDAEHDAAPLLRQKTPVLQETPKESELPAGISLDLKLETPITFEASAVGDPIMARLNRPVHASEVSIPKGAVVSGRIRGLEQYYEPKKSFVVSLEFFSVTSDGKRAMFQARLVGPSFEKHVLPGSSPHGGLPEDEARIETTGFDIDKSAPRFGVFRVPGDSLHLGRGLRMTWETQGVPAVAEPGETSARPAAGTNLTAAAPPLTARQEPADSVAPQTQPEPSAQPEPGTHEVQATFTTRVNLVMVPAVVRDRLGRVVAGLTKDQFRLFDNGKLQEISRFTVEEPGSQQPAAPPVEKQETAGEGVPAPRPSAAMPRRFIGYLFDDVHVETADLIRARAAAERHIETQLKPTDRAAIFTTSGQGTVNFTDDRDEIRNGLTRLAPRPIARSIGQECPDISYYQADLILNQQDAPALDAAIAEVLVCLHPKGPETAAMLAKMEAQHVLKAGEHETQVSLAALREAVQRMATMPGERVLVLVSPGFLTLAEHQPDEYDAIEHALRAGVVINVLNARGVYTESIDSSRTVMNTGAERIKQDLLRQSQTSQETLLMEIAADTGGVYFHNNNDLDEGFRRTASSPELYYLLGFQPQDLKLDGSFHRLKVAVESKGGYAIEARRGYYTPTHVEDAAAAAKREIEDAVYSREELRDLPVTMQTQFSKGAGDAAAVTVLVHLDVANGKFRKADGRSVDHITLVSALFDHNWNLVTGQEKHVDLHPRAGSPQNRAASGITVPMSLEAKPGSYLVRLVVGDSKGELMAAINGTVDIP